ncbi:uncharacterized protein LOC131047868 isoform X1 [Cryptomeria japonica]|uniref:uncharacterized protein LOC131047868 isoform X1 n=1 Tax=Cryptomeria japonica TaxID=3369 RepID=UPI0027DA85E9|nr:uncharacterized protein LOC131047868 isoform X1 [Cryptomeria japonica]
MAVEEKDEVQLEFKSDDNAWYDVSLKIKGSELLVHYLQFPEEEDDTFPVEYFKSVEDFRSRFRFSSQQLQDQNCGRVKGRMNICASYGKENEDIRFYNAVVKRVCRFKHHQKGGEEVCRCTFEVLWKDGPCANKNTSVTCENICLLTSGNIESHPVVKAFVKLIKEKVEQALHTNTIKKKVVNFEGNNTTNYKSKQGEPVKTASNLVSINGHEGICIISGQERVENLSDSFKQNVGPRNAIEAVFSGINEVAASSPHMPPISSQSCKMKELIDDRLNAVDNDAVNSEVLLQDHLSSSEVMGSQNNISRSSQAESREQILKTTVEAPLCTIIESTNEAPHSEAILIKREETHLDSLRKKRKEEKLSLDLNSEVELEEEQLDIPSHSEACLMKQEKTFVDPVRKEQKLSLDLNSKVELEQEQLDIPTTRDGFHSNANNANGKDNGFLGASKNVVSPENQGPFRSGWLEAEDCGTLHIGKGGFNAINNEIAGNSDCLITDIRNKGSGLSDDHAVSACTGIKRPSSYDFENLGEQVTEGENTNDEKIREKKRVLASSWGKGKRQKHISNELFSGERKVQDHNQTSENANTSKKLTQDGNDFDGVDSLSSSYSTPHLKNSTSRVTTETLDLNREPDNHVQLEEVECNPLYMVKSEGQKIIPPIQKDYNHYASEKSNYCSDSSDAFDSEQDLEKCQCHLTSKECESHPSGCRCCDLHCCSANTLSEDESFDVEVTSCNFCGKYLKPILLNSRTSTRICKDPQEARCGCNGAGLGHCSEGIGAEDRHVHYSEVLVLDNLEKDVRPSDVKKVMACVTCAVQVYIFPSLKVEQFTRGFVWFRDHSSLMKAFAFLQNDEFFIISSNGRPWVALLLHIDNEVCKGIFGGCDIEPEDTKHCCLKTLSSKISRVQRGTDEYERAKIRKNMFLEFKEHLAILHKRLELELEECSRH